MLTADVCLQCQPAAKASPTRPSGRRMLQAPIAQVPSAVNPAGLPASPTPLQPVAAAESNSSSPVPDYGQCAGSGFGTFFLPCAGAEFTCVRISDAYWQVGPSNL